MRQLPVLRPEQYLAAVPLALEGIVARVLELTYTACDLTAFARDCGWHGSPFIWNEERRFLMRCELDAAFFAMYLGLADWEVHSAIVNTSELKVLFPTPREAVEHIMDTFPIVRRKDEEVHGDYRTKRVILEIYDAMLEAIRVDQPYRTRLDPPAADPNCCHSAVTEERLGT